MHKARQRQLYKGLAIGAAVLAVLYLTRVVLLPLALAAVLCYMVLPLARFLERRHFPKGLAALLSLLAFFGGLVALGFWGWPRLCRDFSALGALVPRVGLMLTAVSQSWQVRIAPVLNAPGLSPLLTGCCEQVFRRLGEFFSDILEQSLLALPGLIGSLSLLVFTPIFAFYLLRDREQLLGLMPRSLRPMLADLNHILQSFVRGYLLVAAVVGILFGLLNWVFGLSYSFTLGLIMLLAELVPYLGPFLAFFPCMALGLVQGELALVKLLLIWFAVQQLENLLISPHIMSGVMRLPPFYIMLAVLVGGFWWGIFGMILAVPLAAAIKVVWNALVIWWRRDEEHSAPESWVL